ncbi:hypothetical protein [Anaerovibrio sp.]|uniref:hypothetical protein n=1 Tax=Anaerovibrio sp. TaxID=1872532 RepID=UPI003F158127
MRMSRVKGRRLRLQQQRERMHCKKKAVALVMTGLAASVPLRGDAATLTVLQDINGDFDYMENNLERIRALDMAKLYMGEAVQNMSLAGHYLEEAEGICRDAAENLRMAEENQLQAEEQVRLVEAELKAARENRQQLTSRALASQQAVADYLPVWYEAQAELQQRLDVRQAAMVARPAGAAGSESSYQDRQRAEWIEAAWEEAGFENNRLPELELRFAGAGEGVTAAADEEAQALEAYWERMAELDAEADAAQEYFDDVSSHLDELKELCRDAEEEEAEASREIVELEMELSRSRQDVLDCRQDVEICRSEQTEAITACFQALMERNDSFEEAVEAEAALKHFGEGSGAQSTLEYYSWHGATGGHQLYNANSWYWNGCQRELSISNAYVYSDTGLPGGSMSGITDTTVSAMHVGRHQVYDVSYGMEINLPTGESRVHSNAVVPDDLARVSRLGEGWNFTPRLEVAGHIDKYTDWRWRSAYSFRGGYNDSMEDMSSVMHPGNFWSNELEYLHTDDKQQYMLKLQYTRNEESSLTSAADSYRFRDGNGLVGRGYYRSWFTPRDSWGAYLIWSFDGATAYDTAGMGGTGLHRLYGGAGWFHRFDARRQMRLFANWLRTEGDMYEPLTRQSYSAGRRFSVSLGYDWRMDERNSMSLALERAVLHQQGGSGYHSWGVMMSYNRSF